MTNQRFQGRLRRLFEEGYGRGIVASTAGLAAFSVSVLLRVDRPLLIPIVTPIVVIIWLVFSERMLRASASRQPVQRRGRGIRLLVLVGLCVFLLSVVFLFNAWRPSSFAFYVTVTAVIISAGLVAIRIVRSQ
jgi:hypothetical protein